jgi:hypothetical protein
MPVAFRSAQGTHLAPGSNQTTFPMTTPAGVEAGDLLIALLLCNNSDDGWAAETGWTQEQNETKASTSSRFAWYWRIADGGEGATVTFDYTPGTNRFAGGIMAFTGADLVSPINVWARTLAQADPIVCPSVITTVPNCLIIRASNILAGFFAATPPAEYTERYDVNGGAAVSANGHTIDINQAAAGATGTAEIDVASAQHNSSYTIAVAPIPVGGDPGSISGSVGFGLGRLLGPDFRTFRGY